MLFEGKAEYLSGYKHYNQNGFNRSTVTLCVYQISTRLCKLGANHLTSEGGGEGWVILEKNILQVHMRKKKFPAQDYCPKKIHARTVGWKKNSGKMFPGLTH